MKYASKKYHLQLCFFFFYSTNFNQHRFTARSPYPQFAEKKNCQLFATFFKLTCWKVARVREFEGPSIIMLVGADRADNIKDSKTFDRISLRKISKYSVNISRYATLTAVHVIDSCLWRFKMSAFPVTINKNSILN